MYSLRKTIPLLRIEKKKKKKNNKEEPLKLYSNLKKYLYKKNLPTSVNWKKKKKKKDNRDMCEKSIPELPRRCSRVWKSGSGTKDLGVSAGGLKTASHLKSL